MLRTSTPPAAVLAQIGLHRPENLFPGHSRSFLGAKVDREDRPVTTTHKPGEFFVGHGD